VRLAEAKALSLLLLQAVADGQPAAAEAAANKLAGSELCQRIARTAFELGAADAVARDTPLEFLWRQSISETIGGGTSEVMRGVIARTRLGLAARR
jgi:3-oxocholest-4-en-26-oyl-CoA dehydrogenase alpha subunit